MIRSEESIFLEWSKIINLLAKNFPQVPRYQQWRRLEFYKMIEGKRE